VERRKTSPLRTRLQCPVTADPLGETLHLLRLAGVLYFRSELTAPWGMEMPVLPGCLSFHVVTSGQCMLEVGRRPAMWLSAGDLVFLPLGAGHLLRSERGVAVPGVERLHHEQLSERYAVVRHGGGGAESTMFCGALRFGHPAASTLVAMLPEVIHVDVSGRSELGWMRTTLELLESEARSQRAGSEALAMRLADLIVVQAIREWVVHDPEAQRSWLAALRDDQIARAIALIHGEPSHPWTLAGLADRLGMSRSVFAARFSETMHEPAMQYVTRWKMQLAFTQLSERGTSVALVADWLGYQSEASFSRAFKRVMGFPPGKAKRLRWADAGADAELTPVPLSIAN
jgi:AraC-like DNA-binding protein